MTARHVVAGALLATGIGIELLSCLGVLRARDAYDRLHYLGAASTLGAALVCAAVLVNEGFDQAGDKAVLLAVILAVCGPVLTHATGRAARIRAAGRFTIHDTERERADEPAG
ncbi:MAG: mrpG [Solirubrobacterales bacterium]|nr:mrpG [Solirubrobacterales bacterium]